MQDAAIIDRRLSQSLIDSLYGDALLLADEARAWFDRARGPDRVSADIDAALDLNGAEYSDDPLFDWAGRHDPSLRIALSCESLRLTTRLMHIIAWLLLQRAIAAGELSAMAAQDDHNRLGPSPDCNLVIHKALPLGAQRLIDASLHLHARVAKVEAGAIDTAPQSDHPVHAMFDRLSATL